MHFISYVKFRTVSFKKKIGLLEGLLRNESNFGTPVETFHSSDVIICEFFFFFFFLLVCVCVTVLRQDNRAAFSVLLPIYTIGIAMTWLAEIFLKWAATCKFCTSAHRKDEFLIVNDLSCCDSVI